MKTKTNKIPLVGPRGRQEILKKVEQIAQQGYIKIHIGQITALTNEEKATIDEHVQAGTIFDVIFEEDNGELHRVISVWPNDKSFAIYSCVGEDILYISY